MAKFIPSIESELCGGDACHFCECYFDVSRANFELYWLSDGDALFFNEMADLWRMVNPLIILFLAY